MKVPVTTPVYATVGSVHLRLFPYRLIEVPPDDSDELPWAWGALCRVTFDFGDCVTTKRLTAKWVFWGATPEAHRCTRGRRWPEGCPSPGTHHEDRMSDTPATPGVDALARFETYLADPGSLGPTGRSVLIRDLAAALQAERQDADLLGKANLKLEAELAAGHAVTRRLLDGWLIDGQDPDAYPELWVKNGRDHEHVTDAERAWLAAVEAS